jgi:hypothetical protein
VGLLHGAMFRGYIIGPAPLRKIGRFGAAATHIIGERQS